MTTTAAQAYRQALVRWTDGVRRLAWLVVAASVFLSAAAAAYLAENIRINTDTGDMLSADLAFRRHSAEMDKAFPQFSDNLIVVIDGDSPDLSDDAARALAFGHQASSPTKKKNREFLRRFTGLPADYDPTDYTN